MTGTKFHLAALAAAALLAACATTPEVEPAPQRYSGVLLQWFEGQSFRADGEAAPWAYGMSPEAMAQLAEAYPEDYAPGPMHTTIIADVEGVLRPVHPDAHRHGSVGGYYEHYLTITRVHEARLLRPACEPMQVRVYFDMNQAALSEMATAAIDEAVRQTGRRACNVSRIHVVGHTDTVGSAASNLALSERRAGAVREALIARGVDAALMTIEAAGEERPLLHTLDNVREPLNRYVEITIEAPAGETR